MAVARNPEINAILLPCAKILNEARDKRLFVISKNIELLKISKKVASTIDMIFRFGQNPYKETGIREEVHAYLRKAKIYFGEISERMAPGDFYKYQNMWRVSNQNLITAVFFVYFLENNGFADIHYINEMLGSTHYSSVKLIKEQCLMGMTHFFHLLVRLGICLGIQGDLRRSHAILKFYLDVINCTKNTIFSMEHLRRSCDKLKIEIKSTERTIYELYVRKILNLDGSILDMIERDRKEYLTRRQKEFNCRKKIKDGTLILGKDKIFVHKVGRARRLPKLK